MKRQYCTGHSKRNLGVNRGQKQFQITRRAELHCVEWRKWRIANQSLRFTVGFAALPPASQTKRVRVGVILRMTGLLLLFAIHWTRKSRFYTPSRGAMRGGHLAHCEGERSGSKSKPKCLPACPGEMRGEHTRKPRGIGCCSGKARALFETPHAGSLSLPYSDATSNTGRI